MEQPDLRTWMLFFIIASGVLLWALFLSVQGVMLWVSLVLVMFVLGVAFFWIFNQISLNASRKKVQKELIDDLRRSNDSHNKNSGADDRKPR